MAPNSSSVFNEAPTEAKPTEVSTMAAPTAPATPTPSPQDAKQAAPKMEPTIGEDESRFARVSPAGLDQTKKTLAFRKSCLKRSSAFLPSPISDLAAIQVEKVQVVSAPVDVKEEPALPVQKNRRRCWECKAKIGLTAVTCRCDYTFCNKHRYAEEHKCRYNFKGVAKRKLEEENPRVVPAKVARIN